MEFLELRTFRAPPEGWAVDRFAGIDPWTGPVRILSVVLVITFLAKQVIHKGDGPKLPYQAVVIRQSAMHRRGRNAMASKGGVDPHTSSGPTPGFGFFGCSDLQSGKYGWKESPDGDRASTTSRMLAEDFGDNFRFTMPRVIR